MENIDKNEDLLVEKITEEETFGVFVLKKDHLPCLLGK